MKRRKFKIRPVDMCIYIDNNIYKENHNVELIFEYLQDLFYSLSIKKRFFSREKDYDQYSLYGATQAYLRLTNKNQFLPENDPKKIPKIKSILNWIKRVLYGFKVDYQKEEYKEIIEEDYLKSNSEEDIKEYLNEQIKNNYSNALLETDVQVYFNAICKTISNFLKNNLFTKDKLEFKNIYMSCLITLLRSITLSNENINKLYLDDGNMKLNIDDALDNYYYEESLNAPLAWHLDKDQETYIAVLTNNIKSLICTDIKELCNYYNPNDDLLKDILMSPLSENKD